MSAGEDTVKAFMTALETKDLDTARSYLTEDFVLSGWTPQPLDAKQLMAVIGGLQEGIPNLLFHFHSVHDIRERQEDSRVRASTQLTGTQTEGFVLPPLGLPPIPQTAKMVSLPEEQWNYTVVDDKITRIAVEHAPSGGIQGLLQQLGVDVPIIQ
ncbi:MAG: hypothetical protein NVSMB33_01610 [Ktedonobacteraceae bacterium]